jgi:hypothetical protein
MSAQMAIKKHQNEIKKRKKIDLQRMCAGIRVLDNNIENFKMLKNDAQRPISFLNNRIRTKTEFRKDGGNQRIVECDVVNKGVIGAVRRQVEVKIH